MFSNGVLVGCLLFFLFTGSLLFFTTPFITHLIVPPYPECLGNVALERHLREIVADETKLTSCYEDYFSHFGMSAKSFPTWDKFEARTERYMTNEPGLARPTLCSWHRSLARCLGAGTERSPISKEALRSAFGLPEADAFSFALSFESNQYECGEGFKTVSDYADCLEEVRNCDKSEVDAAVQGCTQGRTTEVRNIKGAQRECSAERIANECLYRFGVMKCGKAVEKYYCKMQEFVSRRRIFEGAAQCPEPFQCEL